MKKLNEIEKAELATAIANQTKFTAEYVEKFLFAEILYSVLDHEVAAEAAAEEGDKWEAKDEYECRDKAIANLKDWFEISGDFKCYDDVVNYLIATFAPGLREQVATETATKIREILSADPADTKTAYKLYHEVFGRLERSDRTAENMLANLPTVETETATETETVKSGCKVAYAISEPVGTITLKRAGQRILFRGQRGGLYYLTASGKRCYVKANDTRINL